MQEISEKILAAVQKIRRKQKLTADLQNVREKLAREKSRYEKLQRQLQKEDSDVKKLEGISITALFYSILGSKEQQLEKERQELLAAVLQYEQCKQVLRELTADENKLLKELKTLRGAEAEYAKLLQEKEKLILAAESPQVEILLTLAEELANLEANKKELEEAIIAGREVLDNLTEAGDALGSAGNWGAWDMLGGGMLATAIKHSKIDDAEEAINKTQAALERFSRELQDVKTQLPDIRIEIDSFARFADYFFDGLIVDWVVQSRINHSRKQVSKMKSLVRQVLQRLERNLQNAEKELAAKKKQRIDFITAYQ